MSEAKALAYAVCTGCDIRKPIDAFNKAKTRPNGHQNMCRECHRKYSTMYRKTEQWKANHRKKQSVFIKKHPERDGIYRQAHKVPLASECNRCSANNKRLVRHHPDYTKPEEVISLCDLCHRAVHKELTNA